MGHLTIYPARCIRTMDDDRPTAEVVGVLDGRIAGVGTWADLAPWMAAHEHTVDERFADDVLMPGFIDPHLHPLLPAVLTQMPFIAPDPWSLPNGEFPAAPTPEEYWRLLGEHVAAHDADEGPFFTWGYHQLFHGTITRRELDERLPRDVPVALWHRSFHEVVLNSAALEWAGLTTVEALPDEPLLRASVDLDTGHFWERGMQAVQATVAGRFMQLDRLAAGLATFVEMVHRGGVTTVADMGTGLFLAPEAEAAAFVGLLEKPETPFRMLLTPVETWFVVDGTSPDDAVARVQALEATGGEKVFFDRHLKLMIDGAFYSQAFQLSDPGYIDGHAGEWMVPPDVTGAMARAFWNAGYQLHAHVNGDQGAQVCLDLLQGLLDEHPRVDHRFTMEHWGYSTEEQARRLAVLGGQVSGQPYYVYMLGDKYSESGLGPDRAHLMSRFGSAVRHGIPLALHSDCPMAPVAPLRLAWAAATRRTLSGAVVGESQRLTVEQALRAITVDAAWVLRLENEIGTIRTGKRADFTVLGEDPALSSPEHLSDIEIRGTVLAGVPQPLTRPS